MALRRRHVVVVMMAAGGLALHLREGGG